MNSQYQTLLHYALLPNPIGSIEDEIYELSIDGTKAIHAYNRKELKLLNSILKDLKGKLEEY